MEEEETETDVEEGGTGRRSGDDASSVSVVDGVASSSRP